MNRVYFLIAVGALAVLGAVIGDKYFIHILILCFIWSMVVAGWDLVLGYAGIVNFAQLVFFAVGAYGSSMAAMSLGAPSITPLLVGMGCAGVVGLLIGLPCLRLRGEFIALFTFTVHLALPPLIRQGRRSGPAVPPDSWVYRRSRSVTSLSSLRTSLPGFTSPYAWPLSPST